MDNNKLIITPKTKVLQLIEAFPHLEDVITGLVPAINKLKNPALRRTVAGVATIQQVAALGNINIAELINKLRHEAGQDGIEEAENSQYASSKPGWFDGGLIAQEFDVREMLAAGEHPVGQVISDLSSFPVGRIYKLTAPFLPVPLIDKAAGLGYEHWAEQDAEELFNVYFYKGE